MLHRILPAATQGTARSHLQVPPPIPPRAPSPPKPVAIALDAVNNAPAPALCASVTLPASQLNDVCMSDDEGWGSDFDDDRYTEAEMAEFDARFDQDTRDIAAFNLANKVPDFNARRLPPPSPPKRAKPDVAVRTPGVRSCART